MIFNIVSSAEKSMVVQISHQPTTLTNMDR